MLYYVGVQDVIRLMKQQEGQQINKYNMAFSMNDKPFRVDLAYQKTGFGEKAFLICPRCGSRRAKLYRYGDGLICRECLPFSLYSSLTNTTKGGWKSIAYRLNRLARRNGIVLKGAFCYLDYPKPKGKNDEDWSDLLTKLQALENMRNQGIFFGKIYSTKTINSVLKGRNVYLYVYTPYDLCKYFYDWDVGYLKYPGNAGDVEATGITSQARGYQRLVANSIRKG